MPNFVTVDQVQYASIDGTWWFVRALDELWRQSGDDDFAARDGAGGVPRRGRARWRTPSTTSGFLTHGDGETWMDGGGEENPYSPRGNRAVEVQALWHRGLLTAARLAERFRRRRRDPQPGLRRRTADTPGRRTSTRSFWQGGRLVDHLNADGIADTRSGPTACWR